MSHRRSVSDSLDLLVDPFDTPGDWEEILSRAGQPSSLAPHRRVQLRPLLVVAVAVSCLLAAAAFAASLSDRFSSWVSGSPGTPAPASDQSGFAERNRVAFASFPEGTTLRLLMSRNVGGTTFNLLGFRNGDAYCLRLARADRPNGIGQNACLRAAELRGRAALVAGEAWFSVGDPAQRTGGVFGFASDEVSAVAIRRTRSRRERVPVQNNVFLALKAQPRGTVQRHPLPNRVLTLTALLRNGGRRNIPYVVDGQGVYRGGRIPRGPSYFGPDPSAVLPGPTRVVAPIRHPRVGWLERREPRGAPLTATRFMTPEFGRFIQPDPNSPIRVGVARASSFGLGGRTTSPPRDAICLVTSPPLALSAGAVGCSPVFSEGGLILGPWLGAPILNFAGVAADGITRVSAHLASGRTVEAALRDNVFSVAVPQADLGARFVGYDSQGRVAAIAQVPGNAVALPCPAADLDPTPELAQPRTWERIHLGEMTVAGEPILGRTLREVVAVLGEPTRTIKAVQRVNGIPIPELWYGGTTPAEVGLTIRFVKKGTGIYANQLRYQSPSLLDAKLGQLLRLQPQQLQRKLAATYSRDYRLYRSYGSDPTLGCTGTFLRRSSPAGISFGIDPRTPARPTLTIQRNGAG